MKRRTVLLGGMAVVAGGATWGFMSQRISASDYAAAMAALRAPLPASADWRAMIRFATLAANGHNTQPWRFRVSERPVEILPDFSRRTPVVDPDDHHLYVSLGCAAENLLLTAQASGLAGEMHFVPDSGGRIVIDFVPGPSRPSALVDAIPKRQSTRGEFDGTEVPTNALAEREQSLKQPGIAATIITDRAKIQRLAELVIAGNTQQLADPAFVAELKQWLRFNPQSALATGDGLYGPASGNPALPTWIAAPLFGLVFRAETENNKYARQMQTAAGAAVITADSAGPEHWVSVGRVCQRFALQATALGLKISFVNQPVEVPELCEDLAALAGTAGRRPDIVMRFGRGPEAPMSPRRPINAVIVS